MSIQLPPLLSLTLVVRLPPPFLKIWEDADYRKTHSIITKLQRYCLFFTPLIEFALHSFVFSVFSFIFLFLLPHSLASSSHTFHSCQFVFSICFQRFYFFLVASRALLNRFSSSSLVVIGVIVVVVSLFSLFLVLFYFLFSFKNVNVSCFILQRDIERWRRNNDGCRRTFFFSLRLRRRLASSLNWRDEAALHANNNDKRKNRLVQRPKATVRSMRLNQWRNKQRKKKTVIDSTEQENIERRKQCKKKLEKME